jgi:hypothetical protein
MPRKPTSIASPASTDSTGGKDPDEEFAIKEGAVKS